MTVSNGERVQTWNNAVLQAACLIPDCDRHFLAESVSSLILADPEVRFLLFLAATKVSIVF